MFIVLCDDIDIENHTVYSNFNVSKLSPISLVKRANLSNALGAKGRVDKLQQTISIPA